MSSKPKHPSVLIVGDVLAGHITMQLRGLIFRELFEQAGWNVRFIAKHPGFGIKFYRNLRLRWRRLVPGLSRFSDRKIVSMAREFDIVYLLKVQSLRLVKALKEKTSAKVVFDLTDALWRPAFQKVGWHNLDAILETVDAVFSENHHVCSYGEKHNPNVISIPACSQVERFDELRREVRDTERDEVVIGWVGSPSTAQAIAAIREPLDRLGKEFPNVRFRAVGCDESMLPSFHHLKITARREYNEDDMIREVLQMDIGVFPPPSDFEDYNIRGALKAMIYMTGGVPPVCQNSGESTRVIEDGRTGMLANSQEEWYQKLRLLVESPQLRREMGQRAHEDIRKEHSRQAVFQELQEAFLAILRL